MPTAGETLLEAARDTAPDAAVAPVSEPSVETAAPEAKPRRPRKPREQAAELTDTPVESQTDATTAAETTTQEPAQPAWMERLRTEFGFDNLTDQDDAINRAIEFAAQQRRDAEELEAWRRQNESFVNYGREYLANRPPEQKPVEQPKPWEPPVAYPEQAQRYLTRKEDGTADWKPETPAEVRAQAEKFIAWREQMQDTLLNRPDVFFGTILPEFIKEHAKQVVEPFYEERTKQQQQQTYFTEYAAQNAEWLYTRDPVTGKPTQHLSQAGNAFDQAVSRHLQAGYTPQEAVEYAQFDLQRQTGATPWVKETPDPAEVRKQRNREHNKKPLNGAGSVTKRDGSFTDTGTRPQNGNVGFGQSFIDRARREGLDLAAIART